MKISGKREVRALSKSLDDDQEQEITIHCRRWPSRYGRHAGGASQLLQGLRREYPLLKREQRNQVKLFILGFYPRDSRRHPTLMKKKSGRLFATSTLTNGRRTKEPRSHHTRNIGSSYRWLCLGVTLASVRTTVRRLAKGRCEISSDQCYGMARRRSRSFSLS